MVCSVAVLADDRPPEIWFQARVPAWTHAFFACSFHSCPNATYCNCTRSTTMYSINLVLVQWANTTECILGARSDDGYAVSNPSCCVQRGTR